MSSRIDWNYPEPRNGLDKFIGPGATKAEIAMQFSLAALFGVLILAQAYCRNLGWTWWQYLIGFLIAIDMAGGVLTNATSSAKRWYHREGQGFKQHLGVVLLHLLQIVIMSWVFMGFDWIFIVSAYAYLVIAALILLFTRHYLQRPVAFFLVVVGFVFGLYVLQPAEGIEWFAPVLYLKILASHLLKEEPYYS